MRHYSLWTAILTVAVFSLFIPYSAQACHNFTLTETSATDNGDGTYTYDFEVCMGIEDTWGFYIDFTGANVISASPNTLTGNYSTVNLSIPPVSGNGDLEYGDWDDTGGTKFSLGGTPGECFNITVTLDGAITDASVTAEQEVFGTCTETTAPTFFPVVPACGDNFYDMGGAGADYQNDALYEVVICPDVPGDVVSVTFSSFSLENNYDFLYVYDNDASSGPSSSYTGNTNPGTITATNSTGCLTFEFDSDVIVDAAGWEATVTCLTLSANFLSFDAYFSDHLQCNKLEWVVSEESDTDKFLIQKAKSNGSGGMSDWNTIGEVAATGSEKESRAYEYQDYDLSNEMSYYRIVEKEFSGKKTPYKAVSVDNRGLDKLTISLLYPMPASAGVYLKTQPFAQGEEVSVDVFDNAGQHVLSHTVVVKGNKQEKMDISSLSNGSYVVAIRGAEKTYTQQLIIIE